MAGFFDPNSQYGGTQNWQSTPLVQQYLEPDIPKGVYTDYLSQNGFGGQDRRSTWGGNQYGQTQSGYQAALTRNPGLSYRDYLTQQFAGGGLANMWAGLAPEQRGENTTRWSGPTRFIGWG